jgi:hypothetical protein
MLMFSEKAKIDVTELLGRNNRKKKTELKCSKKRKT